MQLDLRLLEIFCAVYRERSFSRAAEKLRISQPTISGHIKNLEETLNVNLFERLPRTITPTQAANILYRHGEIILTERQAALQELMAFLDRLEGSLTVSASTIPGEYLLPQLLVEFHVQFPRVEIELSISDSREVCHRVADGRADLGCAGAQLDMVGLEYHHFASDQLVLVVPNDRKWQKVKKISIEDLRRQPFLARESGSGTRLSFERHIGSSLDQFNVKAVLSSTNAVKEGLKAGLGVSVLSHLAVQTELASGLLKTVRIENHEPLRRDFFVVVSKRLTLSPIAEGFLDFLQSQTQKLGLIA
ncbi:selenium metabolism-associated LysR family transcriptional regulator [Acidobacteria bacterium AH-259-D05]|nr:selenium metabolism-associated LysR family transcriptional regulator [Acidobacteria bacterium AH-259-D05]